MAEFSRRFVLCFLLLSININIFAQTSEDEHKSHHPDSKTDTSSQPKINETTVNSMENSNTTSKMGGSGGMMKGMMGGNGGMMKGMMGGKGGMMKGMMGGKGEMMPGCPGGNCGKSSSKTWDIYPTLMNLRELTPEKRKEIIEAANKRIKEGKNLIESGAKELNSTSENLNYKNLENSLEEIRQGVSLFDSGIAANKAIEEGKAPKNIALRWFKKEMNLIPMSLQGKSNPSYLMGMSPFHTSIMAILILFMAVMIWMYFFKMKRAALLLEDLSKRTPFKEDNVKNSKPSVDLKKNDTRTKSTPIETEKFIGNLEIIGIFEETSQVKTFRLAHADSSSLSFTYEPGQFVTFILEIEGKKVRRSYTISSSPTERDFIEVTIKREDKGLVSRYFHDSLKVHDQVEVNVPNGKFYFNGDDHDSIVLISGGVGVTPMMSAVRYLTARCWSGEIYFLFCARTNNDFIYQQELEYLQARYENLNVLVSMTRAKGTSWMGPQGRFTKEQISGFIPDIQSKRVHVCGPGPMMDAVMEMLAELGVSKEQIKTEAFGGAKPKLKEKPKINAETSSKIFFKNLNRTVDISPEQTILEVAEEAGVEIENSCRSGTCGMCKVKLLSGKVSMEVEDSLEEEEKNKGIILACQAKADEDVSIEV